MWGQTQPEQRLKRLEGLLGQLLGNPSLDNARRGPLQVPEFDSLPGAPRMTRVQVLHPPWLSGSAGGSAAGNYDATNQWPYIGVTPGGNPANLLVPSSVASFAATTFLGSIVSLAVLPDFRIQIAHPNQPLIGTRTLGFINNFVATPDGAYFRQTTIGNWLAVTRAGGVETATDTGVASSTAPMLFRIRIPSPTQVEFFIDGDLVHRETATLPSATTPLFAGLRDSGSDSFRVGAWVALSYLIFGT